MSSRSRSQLGILPFVLVSLWLAGCSGDESSEDSHGGSGFPPTYEGDPYSESSASGVLSLDGSCLYIGPASGPAMLAFPDGHVEWDEDGRQLSVDGNVVSVGDVVTVDGRLYEQSLGPIEWQVAPDPSCDTTYIWLAGTEVQIADDGTSTTGLPATYTGEPNGDDAAALGTLTVEGECLYLDGSNSRLLVAFPAAITQFDKATGSLTVGVDTVAVGDYVQLGGSELAPGSSLQWATAPDTSCDTERVWVAGDDVSLAAPPGQ